MYKLKVLGEEIEVERGTSWEQVADMVQDRFDAPIAAVSVNGKIRELFKKVNKNAEVEFFTLNDDIGKLTYTRTATMLAIKSIFDIFGENAANTSRVDFSIANGLFIRGGEGIPLTDASAEKIEKPRVISSSSVVHHRSMSTRWTGITIIITDICCPTHHM